MSDSAMSTRIAPPESGVEVRMYRFGHGDCFLLNFKRRDSEVPYFMLIDCGKKAGSEPDGVKAADVLEQLHADTGGVLDLVAVTHEHEDHTSEFPKNVNDIGHPFAKRFEIKNLWLAWTEDGEDDLANRLRELYGDKLLALAMVQTKLSELTSSKGVKAENQRLGDTTALIGDLLDTEIGERNGAEFIKQMASKCGYSGSKSNSNVDDQFGFLFAAENQTTKIKGLRFKRRLEWLRNSVDVTNITFIRPDSGPYLLPDFGAGVRVYPFGPPRDEQLLTSLDPRKSEEFHVGPFEMGSPGAGLFAAFRTTDPQSDTRTPFEPRHCIPEDEILKKAPVESKRAKNPEELTSEQWLRYLYRGEEADPDRRIDGDWLEDGEAMALRLNSEVNNTSLVLLFELTESKKTLLFTGDAQRGSWVSWSKLSWRADGRKITAKELLGRCVFYKVGHHGSHNATLAGTTDSEHANLSWLAKGRYADHFVAMIPSNTKWAGKKKPFPWRHPLPAIQDALVKKAKGRVLMVQPKKIQTPPLFDEDRYKPMWDEFRKLSKTNKKAFVSYTVLDEPAELVFPEEASLSASAEAS